MASLTETTWLEFPANERAEVAKKAFGDDPTAFALVVTGKGEDKVTLGVITPDDLTSDAVSPNTQLRTILVSQTDFSSVKPTSAPLPKDGELKALQAQALKDGEGLTVVVVGGAGYLGACVVRALLAQKFNV